MNYGTKTHWQALVWAIISIKVILLMKELMGLWMLECLSQIMQMNIFFNLSVLWEWIFCLSGECLPYQML